MSTVKYSVYGDRCLQETLATLDGAGIWRAGAGRSIEEGMDPVVIPVPGRGREHGSCVILGKDLRLTMEWHAA